MLRTNHQLEQIKNENLESLALKNIMKIKSKIVLCVILTFFKNCLLCLVFCFGKYCSIVFLVV